MLIEIIGISVGPKMLSRNERHPQTVREGGTYQTCNVEVGPPSAGAERGKFRRCQTIMIGGGVPRRMLDIFVEQKLGWKILWRNHPQKNIQGWIPPPPKKL